MGFIDEIKAKAKTSKKTIVLPETEDIRTYEAAEAVLKEGTANLILIGSEEEIAKNKGDFDISGATIVDPATYEKTEAYIAKLVELRQKKGMTEEQARELLLTNYLYYGVMMVKMKDADGMVSGACHSTADTLRPCLQILKTKPGTKLVSAFFVIRSGAESGSGEACSYRSFFRRFFPSADRKRAGCGYAFPLHQGKRKTPGCRQSRRSDPHRKRKCAGRPSAGWGIPA